MQLHSRAVLTRNTGQIGTYGPGERLAPPDALPPLPTPPSTASLNNRSSHTENIGNGAPLTRVNANTNWTRGHNQHEKEHSTPAVVAIKPNNEGLDRSNAARRFLHTIKAVLCFNVVNALLVLVPIGIAARTSTTHSSALPVSSLMVKIYQYRLTCLADFTQMPAGVVFVMDYCSNS